MGPPGQKAERSQLNKIQPDKGEKLQKWSKKVETITSKMNFKLATVSSLCFTISWVHFLPHRAIQRQQGGEAGAVLATTLVSWFSPPLPGLPSCTLTAAPGECLFSNSLSLSVFVEAFHKLHQCLRELCWPKWTGS